MRRGKRGQILILVLGVMGLGMFVVAPLLAYVDLSFRLNMRYQIKTESYLAAEAGIERVVGDLYMGTDIRVPAYDGDNSSVNSAPAVLGDFYFHINVTEPTTLGVAPLAVESYLDPGSCLGMRPVNAGEAWDYDFFMSHGEDIKVNWVYYTADDACNPTEDVPGWGWTVISLLDENGVAVVDKHGDPIRSEVSNSSQQQLGDDSRMAVNTLYVQGAHAGLDGERGTPDDVIIIDGGPYTLRFRNLAYRGAPGSPNVSVCTPPFKGGDYDHVFSGSINCSELDCSDFIDDDTGGLVYIAVFNENWDDGPGEINTDTFSCDYVELNITRTDGNVSTYTFNNTVPGFGLNRSFWCETTSDPGGQPGNHSKIPYPLPMENYSYDPFVTLGIQACEGGCTNFSAGNYSSIAEREGQRFDVPAPIGGQPNAMLVHIFDIVESSGEVARIDVRWEGYQHKRAEASDEDWNWQADDDQLFLYILNRDPGFPAPAGAPGVLHYLDHREQGGGFIWVKLYQGAYRDYLIQSVGYQDKPGGTDGQFDLGLGEEMVTVRVYLRQSPGPSVWWEEQTMEIMSWSIQYHTQ